MIDGLDFRLSRLTPLGVIALAVAAMVAVLIPVPGPVRAVAVLCFAAIGPGAALAAVLRVPAGAAWVMVTLTGSIAFAVVATEFAALTDWWQPTGVLSTLAVLSAAGAVVAWRRDQDLNTHQESEPTCM